MVVMVPMIFEERKVMLGALIGLVWVMVQVQSFVRRGMGCRGYGWVWMARLARVVLMSDVVEGLDRLLLLWMSRQYRAFDGYASKLVRRSPEPRAVVVVLSRDI